MQLTAWQKAELGDQLSMMSGFGVAPSESDGDAENRSAGSHFLAFFLPLETKLQNPKPLKLGSKNRFLVP